MFGFPRVGEYSAVDEPYWTYDRTPQFWEAIKEGKWRSTNVNDKPGITTATISGIGLLADIDPMSYKDLRENPKTLEQLKEIHRIDFLLRLPIYLFAVLSLPFFYFLLRVAIGKTVALLATIAIGLSPIILGMSLIINPDSLLWIFFPLAILAHLAYGKTQKKKFLIITGILTGFALLTKYVANILFIFFFLLPFLEYIFSEKKPSIKPFLKNSLRNLAIIIGIAMATFALFFPAVWTSDTRLLKKILESLFTFDISVIFKAIHTFGDKSMLLEGTLLSVAFKTTWPIFVGAITFLIVDAWALGGKVSQCILDTISRFRSIAASAFLGFFLFLIGTTLVNTWLGMRWFDLEEIVASPKNSADSATFIKSFSELLGGVYSLIFGLHPILLLTLITAIILVIARKARSRHEEMIIVSFSFFIFFYHLASTLNYVTATVRYQIALYPLAIIIATLGIITLIHRVHLSHISPKKIHLPLALLLILIFSISLFAVRPFYLTYASALLPNTYILNLKDMGDGSIEAARYLNSLPNAQHISIWSDKGAVCAVFVGKCAINFNEEKFRTINPDYLVLSAGRKRKTITMWSSRSSGIDFRKAYETSPAQFSVILGDRPDNFVKVIDTTHVQKIEDTPPTSIPTAIDEEEETL